MKKVPELWNNKLGIVKIQREFSSINVLKFQENWLKLLFFVADGKSKMASIFQISLPSDPMGMC
jgi:hypothetical protein